MIATTYDGKSVFLLNDIANWAKPVEVAFDVLAKRVSGRTNREDREAMAAEMRTTLKYASLLNAAESLALRNAEDAWDNRPVLCPFWPAMRRLYGTATASVVGELKVWFEPGFSAWVIGTGSTPPPPFTPSADCLVAPLLWGRFVMFPEQVTINGEGDHSVSFEVVENGSASFAMRPNVVALTTTTVNTQTVPVLTVPFAWGDNAAQIDVRIKREKIGFGRSDADDYLPQFTRRKQTLRFTALNGGELRQILTLFKDRSGSVKPWMCPKNHTTVSLSLGRFLGDTLRVTWEKPALGEELANCGSVEFMPLPTEAMALTGETPGVTMGGKPSRWFGYVVTDGTTTWRFTSYESPIAGPGGTFEPRDMNHGTITEEINLQVNDCTLDFQNWAESPFTRLRNAHASPALTVAIYEGLIANPAAAQRIYTGTAQAPETTGSRWTVKLIGPGAILSVKGPHSTLQETCSATIGDARCKLNIAAVAITRTLVGAANGVAEFTNGSEETVSDGRFAAGAAKRTLSDGTVQRYLIVDSYKLPNGHLGCVLSGTISPPQAAEEAGWVLEPGCPGTKSACQGFGNTLNFRGAWNLPKANPAMVAVKSTEGGGKK